MLAQARDALAKLAQPPVGDAPGQARIYFDTAAESLLTLYQLHGCQWAAPELRRLYARPDAPPLRQCFSPDGRVLLRVEALELQNPAFKDYTVLLCTFNSNTAQDVFDEPGGALELVLPNGDWAGSNLVSPEHPLWPNLQRLAPQFEPPGALPSGAGLTWKQLYAIPLASLALNQCTLSLDWGGYHFAVPRWAPAPLGKADDDGNG